MNQLHFQNDPEMGSTRKTVSPLALLQQSEQNVKAISGCRAPLNTRHAPAVSLQKIAGRYSSRRAPSSAWHFSVSQQAFDRPSVHDKN
jgi:hypothetical protein